MIIELLKIDRQRNLKVVEFAGVPGSGSDDGITLTALSAWLSEGFYGIRVTA